MKAKFFVLGLTLFIFLPVLYLAVREMKYRITASPEMKKADTTNVIADTAGRR